jgi:RNA polymerase sigma-32 factor
MTTTALIANNLPVPSALGSLDAYIAAVNRVPVLNIEGAGRTAPPLVQDPAERVGGAARTGRGPQRRH